MTSTILSPLWALLVRGAVLAVGLSMGVAAMAADAAPAGPYRIGDIGVTVNVQPGHGLPVRRLSLAAEGDSVLEVGGKAQRFAYPAADLLAAVNVLQRLRFFEMPDQLAPLRRLSQGPDGRIYTQLTRMSDTGTVTLCVQLADFRKCVSYQQDAPPELEALALRLLSDAQRRTGAAGTGSLPGK